MGENTRLIHRWFAEVWNQGRIDAVDELVAEGYVTHGLIGARGQEVSTREAFKEFVRAMRADFADVHAELPDVLEDGDRTVVRYVVTATHRPSGKPVSLSGISIARWKDGRIVEAWNSVDFARLRQEIG